MTKGIVKEMFVLRQIDANRTFRFVSSHGADDINASLWLWNLMMNTM